MENSTTNPIEKAIEKQQKKPAPVGFAEIWDTFRGIDVSAGVEKKGPQKLDYLGWMFCWMNIMEHYPQAKYRFWEEWVSVGENSSTAMVHCEIKIGACVREIHLPVMDHRNNAILNPSTRHISDARMRCLVKCAAMFGLGSDLYTKVDVDSVQQVESEPPFVPQPRQKVLKALDFLRSEAKGGTDHLFKVWTTYNEDMRTTIMQEFIDEWEDIKRTASDED